MPTPNIYYRDAIDEGLWIIKVGKGYVTKRGNDRFNVFWHGQEKSKAICAIETWMVVKHHM
jgi:hypothetical protein